MHGLANGMRNVPVKPVIIEKVVVLESGERQ